MLGVRLLLEFHRLAAAIDLAGARLGDDELAAALGAVVPFANLVSHYLCHLPLDTSFGTIISKPRRPSQGGHDGGGTAAGWTGYSPGESPMI